ncbi:MAG: NCS2 family permease [Kiritimatiellaeota bacterium]|nr:NCS2 family permease [Kiritimatiellota bacterium]
MNASTFFRLAENQTNVRTEILAGLTTFLSMAYILFVQPAVLSTDFAGKPTGLDAGAVLLATCLASAAGSALMGLLARYPIALAPGMGENFFFVSVCMSLTALGVSHAWQTTLAIVFLSGVVFMLLSLVRLREAVIESVSPSLCCGIAAGIGLFIAFIGLKNAGLIIAKPGTLVGLNTHPAGADLAVFAIGLLVAAGLQARKVRGAILLGILLGKTHCTGIIGFPKIQQGAVWQMNFAEAFSPTALPFIAVFLFMVLFDPVGTLVGVTQQAGLMQGNKLPRATQAFFADAAATTLGAALGTSTVTSYIESATGVQAGGRTGLTALTVAALFLLALFFSPLIAMVGGYAPITAPALVLVGALMMQSVTRVAWDDFSEAVSAFLAMLGIPLTFSIADGIALSFVSYPVIKLLGGRGREVRWLMYVVAVLLLYYFVFVRPRVG